MSLFILTAQSSGESLRLFFWKLPLDTVYNKDLNHKMPCQGQGQCRGGQVHLSYASETSPSNKADYCLLSWITEDHAAPRVTHTGTHG